MAAAVGRLSRMVAIWRRDGLGGLTDRVRLRAAYRSPGPWRLRLQGGRFHFVHPGELYAYVETFVRHVYDAVPGFTPTDGWTVVDVGANVGCFSAYALHRMRRGALFALEPNPAAHARLAEVAGAWRARRPALRVTVRRGAAGAVPGHATFVVPDGASIRGMLAHLEGGGGDGGACGGMPREPGAEEGPAAIEDRFSVEVLTLDGWLGSLGVTAVDLLKIDVEGAEGDVAAGGAGILSHTTRVVLEWHGPDRLRAVRAALGRAGLRLVHREADPEDPRVGTAYFRRD